MSHFKRFRYYSEYITLRLLAWIIQCLPWPWLRPLGRFLGSLFFHFDHHRQAVALANLEAAFGEKYDPKTRLQITQKSYGIFATTMLELLWSPRLTPTIMDEIATIDVLDPRSSPNNENISAIYCCLHAANFEWTGQIAARYTKKFPVIAQKFKNPFLGHLFNTWRSSLGQEVIAQEQAMLKLFRYLRKGGKFGILIDLNLKPNEGPILVRTFDRLIIPLTPLPAELALRTGALLVPVECLIRTQGGYHLRFLPPIPITGKSNVASLTQALWSSLEAGIQAHPEYWLWSYKHWRYRPSYEKTDHYPFYANYYEPFDQLFLEQQKKYCDSSPYL